MKTNKLLLPEKAIRICSFLLLILMLTRCTGTEGPPGSDGIDGINYTHSVIYNINVADWVGDLNGYNVSLDVPEITEDIFYEGAVLVYRLFETDPKSFNMLPYSYVDNTLTVYMDFDAYVGSLDLMYKEVLTGVNNTPAPAGIMSFKVVIIEGIPLAKLKGMVDISDYQAVAKMLNIDQILNNIQ